MIFKNPNIVEFISNIPEKLLAWLSTQEALSDFYSWIIFAVIGGGFSSLIYLISKSLWKFLIYRVTQAKNFSEYIGEFYLYHPPLIDGLNQLPRVSKITFESNWLNPGRVKQFNIKPRKMFYEGNFEIHRSVLSCHFNLPLKECPKSIILWHFQKRISTNDRIAFGTMCCINFKEEPYHTPIIVSESRIPQESVIAAFKIMMKPTITRDIRRKLMLRLRDTAVGDAEEEFEHIIVGQGPIGHDIPRRDIIQQDIRNIFRRMMNYF